MKILLTNDDGYRALGIQAVFKALMDAGHEVVIVAPELNSSGAGQSICVYMPFGITQVAENIYFVSSTPADSVRLGLQTVYKSRKNYPDLVISGINLGENVAEDTLYSGTVGAAREAAVHGISALACSTPGPKFDNLNAAAQIIVDLVNKLLKQPKILKSSFVWNVNIPNVKYSAIIGYEATRLGVRKLHRPLVKQITPRGHTMYWQGESGEMGKPEIGTDLAVLMTQDKVSITPIDIFATNYSQMPEITALTM